MSMEVDSRHTVSDPTMERLRQMVNNLLDYMTQSVMLSASKHLIRVGVT